MTYFLYGSFIGFAIGISVGPNAILCLHRSMAHGAWAGIATGIGASIAHILFASIAIFGLHFVQPFFATYGDWIRLIGSVIILFIAVHIGRTPVKIDGRNKQLTNHASSFLTAFLITLSGPLSIASYAVFIAFLNVRITTIFQSIRFLIGVFVGNLAWWIPLSIGSSYFHRLFQSKYVRYINLGAAFLLGALGLFGISVSLYNLVM